MQIGSFPEFLSENSEISLQKILENCGPGKDISPDKIDEIHALWKGLVSDAVIYLKRKDKREFRKAKKKLKDFVINYQSRILSFHIRKVKGYKSASYDIVMA